MLATCNFLFPPKRNTMADDYDFYCLILDHLEEHELERFKGYLNVGVNGITIPKAALGKQRSQIAEKILQRYEGQTKGAFEYILGKLGRNDLVRKVQGLNPGQRKK